MKKDRKQLLSSVCLIIIIPILLISLAFLSIYDFRTGEFNFSITNIILYAVIALISTLLTIAVKCLITKIIERIEMRISIRNCIRNYLKKRIEKYEKSEISDCCIEPRVITKNNENKGFQVCIESWLSNPKKNILVLFGGYGTGKTAIVKRLDYKKAKKNLKSRFQLFKYRIPIFIPLKDYRRFTNTTTLKKKELITKAVIEKYESLKVFDYHFFLRLNEKGRVLWIIDGFDELPYEKGYEQAKINFIELVDLIKNTKSKIIITCRTEFFQSDIKEKEILKSIKQQDNLNYFYLKLFNDGQIEEYLRERIPLMKDPKKDCGYYLEKIKENFKELAFRPILLKMIVETLSSLKGQSPTINVVNIYQKFIKNELDRRLEESRQIGIKQKYRKLLMAILAWKLFEKDQVVVEASEILKLLPWDDYFKIETPSDNDRYLRNFLKSSLLDREGSHYHFSHESIRDFLIVDYLSSQSPKDREQLVKLVIWRKNSQQLKRLLPFKACSFYQAMAKNTIPAIFNNRELASIWLYFWAHCHLLDSTITIPLPEVQIEKEDFDMLSYLIFSTSEKIIELDLQSLDLETISDNLLNTITTTEKLSLSRNYLQKLPYKIGELEKLQILDLSSNSPEFLPWSMKDLKKLQALNLAENYFQEVPVEIYTLPNLHELYLRENDLASLPSEIGGLKRIQILDLSSNSLEELPLEISELKDLRVLHLAENYFEELPREICELPKLQELYLRKNRLDCLPSEIGKLKKLRVLDLADNYLKELPRELWELELKKLNLDGNPLDF
ncbi:MAG: NACHT domain-containing protein [Candidatus Heimdallarchaeota archaeon]|nr:NACHT domain-containing protein [Candidatus Heimdallarchaeota archaeon]